MAQLDTQKPGMGQNSYENIKQMCGHYVNQPLLFIINQEQKKYILKSGKV